MEGEYGAWLCGCGVEWPIDRGTEALSCPRCGSGTLISVRMYGPLVVPDEHETERAEAEVIKAQARGRLLAHEIRQMIIATSYGYPHAILFRAWIGAYLWEHRN